VLEERKVPDETNVTIRIAPDQGTSTADAVVEIPGCRIVRRGEPSESDRKMSVVVIVPSSMLDELFAASGDEDRISMTGVGD
jgi:hypothetical protein